MSSILITSQVSHPIDETEAKDKSNSSRRKWVVGTLPCCWSSPSHVGDNVLWAPDSLETFASSATSRLYCRNKTSYRFQSHSWRIIATLLSTSSKLPATCLTSTRSADFDVISNWTFDCTALCSALGATGATSISPSWGPWLWTRSSMRITASSAKQKQRSADQISTALAWSYGLLDAICYCNSTIWVEDTADSKVVTRTSRMPTGLMASTPRIANEKRSAANEWTSSLSPKPISWKRL